MQTPVLITKPQRSSNMAGQNPTSPTWMMFLLSFELHWKMILHEFSQTIHWSLIFDSPNILWWIDSRLWRNPEKKDLESMWPWSNQFLLCIPSISWLPSGKLTSLWNITILNGKTQCKRQCSSIFNSYVSHYQRVNPVTSPCSGRHVPQQLPLTCWCTAPSCLRTLIPSPDTCNIYIYIAWSHLLEL